MAYSSKERAIAIIITVNTLISVLLIVAVGYLLFQVTYLQDKNKHQRSEWQKLQARCKGNCQTDINEVNNMILISSTAKVKLTNVLF